MSNANEKYKVGIVDCILSLFFLFLVSSLFWGCGKSTYLYYEEAEEYANKSYYRIAIEKYREAINEFPENITLRKNLAYLYYQRKDYENCISELKNILEIEPDNSQVVEDLRHAQIKMAQNYEEDYKLEKAVAVYEKLLKSESENIEILRQLINLNRKLRNESKLILYLKKVPSDSDMYSAALSQLLSIEIRNHNYQNAVETTKKLIKLNPDNIDMRYVLVSLYQKTEQSELAIEQLEEIARDFSESQRAETQKELKNGYLSQAVAFEMKDKLEYAAKTYEKVLELDPDDKMLHHKLGNLFYQMGQYDKAEKHFQEASRLYGMNNAAYLHYMHSHENVPQRKVKVPDINSLKEFKRFLRECVKEYNIELSLVVALIKAESYFEPEAISRTKNVGLMQLGVATATDLGLRVDKLVDERYDPEKNIIAGVKYLRMMLDRYDGVITEALSAYNAGPAKVRSGMIPNYDETRGLIAKVVHQAERYEKYPKELERDIDILATNVIEYQETEIVVDSRIKEAIDMFEKAKSNPVALFNLALLYDEIGQNNRASELYQQLLEDSSVNDKSLLSTVRLNLAYNKFIDGEYDSAYSLLKGTEIDTPQYYYEMGLILAALGRTAQAVKYLTDELCPDSVAVYNTLGYLYIKSDSLSDARENFEKALKTEPKNAFASQGIALTELIANLRNSVDKNRILSGIVYKP